MVIPNIVTKFQNVDIFDKFVIFLDLSSARACRVLSVIGVTGTTDRQAYSLDQDIVNMNGKCMFLVWKWKNACFSSGNSLNFRRRKEETNYLNFNRRKILSYLKWRTGSILVACYCYSFCAKKSVLRLSSHRGSKLRKLWLIICFINYVEGCVNNAFTKNIQK